MSRGSDEQKTARSGAAGAYHVVTTPAEEQICASRSMVVHDVQTPLLSENGAAKVSAELFASFKRSAH